MSRAAYLTKVNISGTPTGMVNQAMSVYTTVANTYRVTDAARRVWDRAVTPVFKGGSTSSTAAISSTAITSVSYLFGTVRFNGAQTTPITVTGNFLPIAKLIGAHAYTLTLSRELLDDTEFDSTGWRSRTLGLFDASLTATRWNTIGQTMDVFDILQEGKKVVLEVNPGGTTSRTARGFFVIESENLSGDVAALEQAEFTFQIDADEKAAFEWDRP